jgi:hypothetical protein
MRSKDIANLCDPEAGAPASVGDFDRVADPAAGLRQRIFAMLLARNVPAIDALEIEVSGGTVTIRGRLPSPQAIRLCIECCRHMPGVLRVNDKLEIEDSTEELAPPVSPMNMRHKQPH